MTDTLTDEQVGGTKKRCAVCLADRPIGDFDAGGAYAICNGCWHQLEMDDRKYRRRSEDTLTDKQVEYLTEHMQVLRLEPGDTVVLTIPGHVSDKTLLGMRRVFDGVWPEHKMVICVEDSKLGVMRNSQETAEEDPYRCDGSCCPYPCCGEHDD
jgi:hypothetical protein